MKTLMCVVLVMTLSVILASNGYADNLMTMKWFSQTDPNWQGEPMVNAGSTIKRYGCTITSVVMAMNYFGISTNPKQFNQWLSENAGYDQDGYLNWPKIADYTNDVVYHDTTWPRGVNPERLNQELDSGYSVILQVVIYLNDGTSIDHFILAVGRIGSTYYIVDPLKYPARIETLAESFGSYSGMRLLRGSVKTNLVGYQNGWDSAVSPLFVDCYGRNGGNQTFGQPVVRFIDGQNRPNTVWSWWRCFIQVFDGGELGECAIVFDPRASVLGFPIQNQLWRFYKAYGGPFLLVGNYYLGGPASNEVYVTDDETGHQMSAQRFAKGYLAYDTVTGQTTVRTIDNPGFGIDLAGGGYESGIPIGGGVVGITLIPDPEDVSSFILQGAAEGHDSAYLQWNDTAFPYAPFHLVIQDGVVIAKSAAGAISVWPLQPNHAYAFQIAAITASDMVLGYSNEVTVTTMALPMPPPTPEPRPTTLRINLPQTVWQYATDGWATAQVFDQYGNEMTGARVLFLSSDPSVFVISGDNGYIIANGIGSAEVWVELYDDRSIQSERVTVTVVESVTKPPDLVEFASSPLELDYDLELLSAPPFVEYHQIMVRVYYRNPTNEPVTFYGPKIVTYREDGSVADFSSSSSLPTTLNPGESGSRLISDARFFEAGRYYFRAHTCPISSPDILDWEVIDKTAPNVSNTISIDAISPNDLKAELDCFSFRFLADEFVEGDDAGMRILIQNGGDRDITTPFALTASIAGLSSQSMDVASLARGEVKGFNFYFSQLPVGSYKAEVFIDSGNSIPEYNEADNIVAGVFSVVSSAPPVLAIFGLNPYVVEVLSGPYLDPGANAWDEEDGDLSGLIVTDYGGIDLKKVGTYVVTYTATDTDGHVVSGARTVNVVDTTKPVIEIYGSNPMTVEALSGPYMDPGANAWDAYDASVTGGSIITVSTVDTAKVGAYSVTYTASDGFGNQTEVIRLVYIVDTTPPVITILGPNPDTVFAFSGPYPETGAQAYDAIDGDLSAQIQMVSTVDMTRAGIYAVTYSVADLSGNATTEVKIVWVLAPLQPDLAIVGVSCLKKTSTAGVPYLEATIRAKNIGSVKAGAFKVKTFVPELGQTHLRTILGLKPGEIMYLRLNFSPVPKPPLTFKVTLDYTNLVVENDETNNYFEVQKSF